MSRIMHVNAPKGLWWVGLIGQYEGDIARIPLIQGYFSECYAPHFQLFWLDYPNFRCLVFRPTAVADPKKVFIIYLQRDGKFLPKAVDNFLSVTGIQEVQVSLEELEKWFDGLREKGPKTFAEFFE